MTRSQEIKRLHQEIYGELRTSLQKAIRIGELLTEQKDELQHGEWEDWVSPARFDFLNWSKRAAPLIFGSVVK